MPLPERDKKLLSRCRLVLVEDLLLEDGLYATMRAECLTSRIQDVRLRAMPPGAAKAEAILDLLDSGDEATIQRFYRCLEATNQQPLIDYMQRTAAELDVPTDKGSPDLLDCFRRCFKPEHVHPSIAATKYPSSRKESGRFTTAINQLKQVYQTKFTVLPLVPWEDGHSHGQLDQLFTQLTLVRKDPRGGEIVKIPLNDHIEMFLPLPGDKYCPQHIHLVGEAGVGKTTLVNKLTLDWVEQEGQAEDVTVPFHAVFVIKLRAVTSDISLVEIIAQQLGLDNVKGDLSGIVAKCNCLVILDGYDEYQGQSVEINRLIQGTLPLLSGCTVLITSRPTKLPPKDCNHKFIEVEGFNKENQQKYMEQFYSENKEKVTNLQEEIKSKSLDDLAKIPILLLMLCTLFGRAKTIPGTLAGLYTQMVQFLYDNHCKKLDRIPDLSLDEVLQVIGMLAWENLKSGNLEFEVNREEKHYTTALELGLLQVILEPTQQGLVRWGQTFAGFLHKSMQEFCAARHLVMQGSCQELSDFCDSLEKVLQMDNVLRFVCGLSGLHNNSYVPIREGPSHDRSLSVCEVIEVLNHLALQQVQGRKWMLGAMLARQPMQVWQLLVDTLHLLGQCATMTQQWTGKWLWYVSPVDEFRWKKEGCLSPEGNSPPPSPVGVYIHGTLLQADRKKGGGQENEDPGRLDISSATYPPYLRLHGRSSEVAIKSLDISRLSVVRLYCTDMDFVGFRILMNAPLKVIIMHRVKVGNTVPLDTTLHTTSSFPYHYVYLWRCTLCNLAGHLLVRAVTNAPKLQHLHIEFTNLGNKGAVSDEAQAPLHLTDLVMSGNHPVQESVRLIHWARSSRVLPPSIKEEIEGEYESQGWRGVSDFPLPGDVWVSP